MAEEQLKAKAMCRFIATKECPCAETMAMPHSEIVTYHACTSIEECKVCAIIRLSDAVYALKKQSLGFG